MNSIIEWSSTEENPVLGTSEIHVWRAFLSLDHASLRHLESTLAEDEKTRAARFIFERDRDHFVAARGILRDLLARYVSRAPGTIKFVYGPHGKPAVADSDAKVAVRFNLSHSHGIAVIAIGLGRELGVDVEMLRPDFAGEDIAKRYFSEREVDELVKLPAELRTEGFFRCWTRKEAYIKARGDGLHLPLDSFSVSLSPDRFPTLSSADQTRWKIESFVPSSKPKPGYAAAVVAEDKDWTSRYFEWKRTETKTTRDER
jgi:4'-phosphopantetheinyl transferase